MTRKRIKSSGESSAKDLAHLKAVVESNSTAEKVPSQSTGTGSSSRSRSRSSDDKATRNPAKSWWRRCLGTWKYVLLIVVAPPLLNYAALQQERRQLPTNGQLYDIGFGQKLFLGCIGVGQPTVILDAPIGQSSDVWVFVQEILAKDTKVCVYDRAGLGFSDRTYQNYTETDGAESKGNIRNKWMEYTVERMVDDLYRLLTFSSQQDKPFIFVGAGLGAMVARFYAQVYESDVSNLVLVEPLVEDLFSQGGGVWAPYWYEGLLPQYQTRQLLAALGLARLELLLGLTQPQLAGDDLPDDLLLRQKSHWCDPKHLSSAVDEYHFINETMSQMQTVFMMKPFPSNVSVTVINGNSYDENIPQDYNKAWEQSQVHLRSKLHPGCAHISVAGHDRRLMQRNPEAVAEPVVKLVKRWRQQQKSLKS